VLHPGNRQPHRRMLAVVGVHQFAHAAAERPRPVVQEPYGGLFRRGLGVARAAQQNEDGQGDLMEQSGSVEGMAVG